jgi:tetratricopeptide (TPR) repeat protein
MVVTVSDLSSYLNTREAAKQIGVSKSTVRDLCRKGWLRGAFQTRYLGRWRIPSQAIELCEQQFASDTEQTSAQGLGPPLKYLRFRFHPVVFYVILSFLVAGFVTALIANVVTMSANADLLMQYLYTLHIVNPIPSERKGETLILVAKFTYTQGIRQTDAHDEIRRAIVQAGLQLGLNDLRVAVAPDTLTTDDQKEATALGKRYNASVVIWGEDSGVRLTVRFLNLKPRIWWSGNAVDITEIKKTQIADPPQYSQYITEGLPAEMTFLSLVVISHSYLYKQDYQNEIRITEGALNTLPQDTTIQGLDEAYADLGWAYEHVTPGDPRAIDADRRAIALSRSFSLSAYAYTNLGIALQDQGHFADAIAAYDNANLFDPKYLYPYLNRANIYAQTADLDGIIDNADRFQKAYSDEYMDTVLRANPDSIFIIGQRGNALAITGDFPDGIADLDRAIRLTEETNQNDNAWLASMYTTRGLAHYFHGDAEDTWSSDINHALDLKPDDLPLQELFCFLYTFDSKFDRALPYCNRSIELSDAKVRWILQLPRGLILSVQHDYPRAVTDFQAVLAGIQAIRSQIKDNNAIKQLDLFSITLQVDIVALEAKQVLPLEQFANQLPSSKSALIDTLNNPTGTMKQAWRASVEEIIKAFRQHS